ncbi:hypothetical protein ES288_D13G022800v1 [Gossypium darwinii]|uniref:Uncharacterized protein n=1 Tax=Gossypium darwinii TaxID=34276 RepID=A0A5D1ZUI0_GOSDA|nr:hypothetical protein ES288_D13G022800v1 [Gossypium darwinii]
MGLDDDGDTTVIVCGWSIIKIHVSFLGQSKINGEDHPFCFAIHVPISPLNIYENLDDAAAAING